MTTRTIRDGEPRTARQRDRQTDRQTDREEEEEEEEDSVARTEKVPPTNVRSYKSVGAPTSLKDSPGDTFRSFICRTIIDSAKAAL